MSLKLRGRGGDTPTNSTQGGAAPDQLNPKWQDGEGGGWSRPTQPKVARSAQICIGGVIQANSTQSAKICLNLHFWEGGRGGGPDQLNPKCQDLPKSAFGEGGMIQTNSTQSGKICPNLHFQGGGRGWWFKPTFLKYLSAHTQVFFNQIFKHSS